MRKREVDWPTFIMLVTALLLALCILTSPKKAHGAFVYVVKEVALEGRFEELSDSQKQALAEPHLPAMAEELKSVVNCKVARYVSIPSKNPGKFLVLMPCVGYKGGRKTYP